MTYNQMKSRLELAKLALGCLALLTIIATSCVNHNVATHTLQKVIQLENVVQEVAEHQVVDE
ncbi:MAG: hypothetical protein IK077_11490 [Thermoguttaceae bacterium]|nr:hypothetical protein [Thermoguttaceae bacterium]